jgi:hypothetical protein
VTHTPIIPTDMKRARQEARSMAYGAASMLAANLRVAGEPELAAQAQAILDALTEADTPPLRTSKR